MVNKYVVLLFLAASCSPVSKGRIKKHLQLAEKNYHHHAGLNLYDLDKGKTVFRYKDDRYYTPASNTKILTLFASLKILPDSIPGLKYDERGDSLIFWGTGDPSFLNTNTYQSRKVFDFLSRHNHLFFSDANFKDEYFGRGWAWDDYGYAYSPEKSSFPIYGNVFETNSAYPYILPSYFKRHFVGKGDHPDPVHRSLNDNSFTINMNRLGRAVQTPFHVTPAEIVEILSDTLDRRVVYLPIEMARIPKVIYSIPRDSLLKTMMQESDNFIAEQLLLSCSSFLSDTLHVQETIEHVQQKYFSSLPDSLIWVDGSGLSRYNLITPRTLVEIWKMIHAAKPETQLFPLLAESGSSGTLKHHYKAGGPFIHGKTGTLSNNHCLSGFLTTKSGRTLIFSYMNSNYPITSAEIRKSMEDLLIKIYQHY